ncbi:MAG TPA: VCBS repeat-containing protein [Segetibacter sp.]
MFEVLESKATGLNFTNHLTSTESFNLFKYMYFYNGAGVGAGDFNNDGLTDLFFSSNQGNNTLYLNSGKLQFKDVTRSAGIPVENAWSTGVSVVDINNDGLLDIYVCRVGKYRNLNSRNQLLVCQRIGKSGIPEYKEEAAEFGLDFSGFSSQATFFDYDMDGDLDMFLLNHSVHENGSFRPRKDFVGTFHQLSGDRMYRNDLNHFTDITPQSKINSSAISYGLGVVVADINLDGYPDLYVGNDFHENDYLYINQKDGTFKEQVNEQMMHTSQFTMGVDAADVNNDGYPEIISVDMLPADPYILKRSLGEDEYDIFNSKISYGYNYQYTRNNFQFNRRNGMFSETALYSGIAATDWSWAPLWLDFDNDGLKDLFVSNGIPKRMNDIDYINFISDQEVQQKIQDNKIDETSSTLIDKFPRIKLQNKFYRNTGNLNFQDIEHEIGNDKQTYSNGAVYADFDNDGDLDVVVNNINDPALLYENKNNTISSQKSLEIKLKGFEKNINAVGAKVVVYANNGLRLYEKYPAHGFLSTMEIPIHIGLNKTSIDSMLLIWPDNTCQPIKLNADTSAITIKYRQNLPLFDYRKITAFSKPKSFLMEDITSQVGLSFGHIENSFPEFDREPLIPHMFSTEGPALATADINHDGLEDVFIGSSKANKSVIFLQTLQGNFEKLSVPVLDYDSLYEETDACWTDVNNDGHTDLVVASGGNEYYGDDKNLAPHIYLNDGKANFTVAKDAFNRLFVNASSIAPYDFNGDGYTDLFIGGRTVPWNYGQIPRSYLLLNDKTGKFKDVTALYAKDLQNVGFVTQGSWIDLDNDGDKDLILSLEWNGITAFINTKGTFVKTSLANKKGWWNFVTPVDIDNDGDLDLIAGNLGLNSRLKASAKQNVKMYFNDFDGNGKKEQVVTYYLNNKEIVFANKAELEKQMPFLKKKFLYAKDFASATLSEIFTAEKLDNSLIATADYFSNAILLNKGNWQFELQALPWEAQLTTYRDAVVVNANGDNLPDVMLVGNYYENNIEMGRYDADYGTLLINKGNGTLACESLNGLKITGQSRHVKRIKIANDEAFVIARNNEKTVVIKFAKPVTKK